MSEQISEAVKEAANAAKDSISYRFGGAFSAYVATTWLGFNWSNIALLFMSNASVEQRIQAIYGQNGLYWNYLIQPILVGFVLSIAIPALNAFVSAITATFSALSDTKQERARLKIDTDLAVKYQKKASVDAQIEGIRKDRAVLVSEVSVFQQQSNELQESISQSRRGILALALRSNKLISDLEGLSHFSNNDNLLSDQQLQELFTSEERKEAKEWRERILSAFGVEAANSMITGDPKHLFVKPEVVNQVVEEIKKQAIIDADLKNRG